MAKIIILVHGLGGASDKTWGKFPELLEMDTDLDFTIESYGYESPHLFKQFWKRAPTILNIANGLLSDINPHLTKEALNLTFLRFLSRKKLYDFKGNSRVFPL